jgi:hypothetical protein
MWYPAVESQAVIGRVIEVETLHPARSREAGKHVYYMAPVMESKVVSGSSDVAHQYLGHLPEWEREAITDRFPGAWENYIAHKGAELGKVVEVPQVEGTPIDKADWIARERLAWLKMQGFSTVEQLAALSDHQFQSLGHGSRTWAKKAKQYLASAPKA